MARFLQSRSLLRLALVVVGAVLVAYLNRSGPASDTSPGTDTVERAFADRASGLVVETSGRVGRILADDREGSPHQRFILELLSDHTVLVAHNLDLADRVPLDEGDPITLRGQYEWNDRGGVIHWTHHDPDGRRPGGWIEHEGRRYH